LSVAHEKGYKSLAFPLIGAGSGLFNQDRAKAVMIDELARLNQPVVVKVVVFKSTAKNLNMSS
jgi:O-acetyl-ADP-ribose deacetylase (regulator of RNase III)